MHCIYYTLTYKLESFIVIWHKSDTLDLLSVAIKEIRKSLEIVACFPVSTEPTESPKSLPFSFQLFKPHKSQDVIKSK